MVLNMIFRVLCIAFLLFGCTTGERDNPYDPDGIITNFVFTVTDYPHGIELGGTIIAPERATVTAVAVTANGNATFLMNLPTLGVNSVNLAGTFVTGVCGNRSGTITVNFAIAAAISNGSVITATKNNVAIDCGGGPALNLTKSTAVTVGGTGSAGSFVDLDPATPVAYNSTQFNANKSKIDMIYGVAFGGGDNIYSTYGAAFEADLAGSTNFSDELLELDYFSFFYSLSPAAQSAVKSATRLSDIPEDAFEGPEVDYIPAANGTVFLVETTEGDLRFVIINAKNGTTSIDIINISGL